MKTKRRVFLCCLMMLLMAFVMAVPMSVSAATQVNVSDFDQLQKAINDADAGSETEITLLSNVSGNNTVFIKDNKQITIDLNGNDIVFAKNQHFRINGGTLNLTGSGKVYEETPWFSPVVMHGSGDESAENYSAINVGKDVTLKGFYGIMIDQNSGSNYGIVANVYGTLIGVTDGWSPGCGLYVNGQITNDNGMPQITLDGATVTAEDGGSGMYLAGNNKTTIKNSKITSEKEGSTGIEIRAGETEISNSTITGGSGTYQSDPNGNGSTSSNTALAVAQHNTKLPIKVVVSNSTLKGGASLAQSDPQNIGENDPNALENIIIDIQNGTFNGEVYSENKTGFISGGTFVNEVPETYIAENVNAVAKISDGTDTVTVIGAENINALLNEIPEGKEVNTTVTITKLDNNAELSLPVGITVKNETGASIDIDGETLENDKTTVVKDDTPTVNPTNPTNPTTNQQGTAATQAGTSPQTGDDFNMALPFAIMALAGLAAVGTVVVRRRTN